MSNYNADFKNGAVNPYNFVRLGGTVNRGRQKNGNLSGIIHCMITTTTPLAIPDFPIAKKIILENGRSHTITNFFKINGQAAIPGSEIRGVIRSAYETLSNSCLSVNNNNILSARSSDVRKPGIVRFGPDKKWHLYEASKQKLKFDGSDDFDETADTLKRTWRNYKYKNRKALRKEGKINVNYKFTTTFREIEVEGLERSIEDYKYCCDIYKNNDEQIKPFIPNISPNRRSYTVYYKKYTENGKTYVYLSPAQISRSVFRHKLDDLLGEHCHCTDPENVCEACGLFGMIGTGNSKISALASRVRFTDAKIVTNPKYISATLKELLSPKISSVEFYTTAPNMENLWTYDSTGVTVNGRKFYFHHTGDYSTSQKSQRNITTELVDRGAQFKFDIYFDKVTEDELKRLVWIVALGENNENSNYQHKIGHGKPLGLGSIKMTVDSIETRTFDIETLEYKCEKSDTDKFFEEVPFNTESSYYKEYMSITDFTFLKSKKVAYPYGDDGGTNANTSSGTLAWFKANHNDGKMVKAGDKCRIMYYLPKLTDNDKLIVPNLIKNPDADRYNNYGSSNRGKAGNFGKGKIFHQSGTENMSFGNIKIKDKRKNK